MCYRHSGEHFTYAGLKLLTLYTTKMTVLVRT